MRGRVAEDAELVVEDGSRRAIDEGDEPSARVYERLDVELRVPCRARAASSLPNPELDDVQRGNELDASDIDGVKPCGRTISPSSDDDEDGVASNGRPISHAIDEDDGVTRNGDPIFHSMVAVPDATAGEPPSGSPMNQLLANELCDRNADSGFARASLGSNVDVEATMICTGSSVMASSI